MNEEILGLNRNITIIAITTAAIIISTCFAVPPAVITLSNEKTVSINMIWNMACVSVNNFLFSIRKTLKKKDAQYITKNIIKLNYITAQ